MSVQNQRQTLTPPVRVAPAVTSLPEAPAKAGLRGHHLPATSDKAHLNGLPLFGKVRRFTSANEVRATGLYPYFRTIASAQDTEVMMNGRKVLMLGSNSYLGLTNHPKVKEAAKAAVDKYGSGCAGSRFLNGTLDLHLELEGELARLMQKEAVLLFSTGFQANLGVVSTMAGKDDYILADKSNHASLVEGCRLSLGHYLRFAHNDMEALASRIAKLDPDAGKLIVVDGVFSMEGDIIQLPEICRLAAQHQAAVMVDDAHGIGVLGPLGAGTVSHFGLTDKVQLIMGTFSKSLASLGGFIATDAATVDYLKHHARTLVFSASMSPANAASALAALRIMVAEPERIEHLWQNSRRLRAGLLRLGFDLGASETPILPVYVRDLLATCRFCKRLEQEGVFVNPVVSPAVPPGQELLRLSLMATHTDPQIDFALDKFQKVGKELGII